ncbi:MAG: hypothetical protein K6V97_14735 [Actinomycetia bacterium]|nr:hypothetical protein [Actinomycetes bacterium]
MIGRSLRASLAVTWGGGRPLILATGIALLGIFEGARNPWDILLASTHYKQVDLLVVPLYLLLLTRDLRHPWEALVRLRLRDARRWWAGHVGAAGLTAGLVVVGIAVLAVIVPLIRHQWTWRWGTMARATLGPAILASPTWRVPWLAGLEELGLLALGLWAIGVLSQVLTLWWRSPWYAWIVLVLLGWGSVAAFGTGLQTLVWWVPAGSQFCLEYHWTPAGPVVAPGWSVLYGSLLLAAATAAGGAIARSSPDDARHGGTL